MDDGCIEWDENDNPHHDDQNCTCWCHEVNLI